jgi:hypothetical protein
MPMRKGVRMWTELICLGIKSSASCEHDNDPSDSLNVGEFLKQLIDYHLLKQVVLLP